MDHDKNKSASVAKNPEAKSKFSLHFFSATPDEKKIQYANTEAFNNHIKQTIEFLKHKREEAPTTPSFSSL